MIPAYLEKFWHTTSLVPDLDNHLAPMKEL